VDVPTGTVPAPRRTAGVDPEGGRGSSLHGYGLRSIRTGRLAFTRVADRIIALDKEDDGAVPFVIRMRDALRPRKGRAASAGWAGCTAVGGAVGTVYQSYGDKRILGRSSTRAWKGLVEVHAAAKGGEKARSDARDSVLAELAGVRDNHDRIIRGPIGQGNWFQTAYLVVHGAVGEDSPGIGEKKEGRGGVCGVGGKESTGSIQKNYVDRRIGDFVETRRQLMTGAAFGLLPESKGGAEAGARLAADVKRNSGI